MDQERALALQKKLFACTQLPVSVLGTGTATQGLVPRLMLSVVQAVCWAAHQSR
jgi:hypothetical protein